MAGCPQQNHQLGHMDMSEERRDGPPIAGWQAFVIPGAPPTGQAVDKIKFIREAGPGLDG